jgi:tRNA(adenine34) deaminase
MQAFTAASEFLGGKHLDQCTLYLTLEPCTMCAGAAYWTRVGRVVFGASDEKRGFQQWGEHSKDRLLHPKTTVDHGILSEECSALIKSFFESKRKKRL